MIRAWKAGNADALAQLMNEDESDPRCSGAADPPQHQLGRWIKARLDKPGTVCWRWARAIWRARAACRNS
jgi:hypothetical protein